jgi:hypothetical protein
VALGPGTWAQLSDDSQQIFIANAPTFLDGQVRGLLDNLVRFGPAESLVARPLRASYS